MSYPELESIEVENLGFQARPEIDLFEGFDDEGIREFIRHYSIKYLEIANSKKVLFAYFNNELKIIQLDKLSKYLELEEGSVTDLIAKSFKTSLNIIQIYINLNETKLYLLSVDGKQSIHVVDIDQLLSGQFNPEMIYEFQDTKESITTFLPSTTNNTDFMFLTSKGVLFKRDDGNVEELAENISAVSWYNNNNEFIYSSCGEKKIFLSDFKLNQLNSIDLELEPEQENILHLEQINEANILAVIGESIDEDSMDHKTLLIELDNFEAKNVRVTDRVFTTFGAIPRIASFYLGKLRQWSKEYPDLLVALGSKSLDADFLQLEKSIELLNDSDRATMPIYEESDLDDSPLGLVIDFNADVTVKEPTKGVEESDPLPRLLILTNSGRLLCWNIWSKDDILNKTANMENGKPALLINNSENEVSTSTNQSSNDVPNLESLSFGAPNEKPKSDVLGNVPSATNPFGSTQSSIFGNKTASSAGPGKPEVAFGSSAFGSTANKTPLASSPAPAPAPFGSASKPAASPFGSSIPTTSAFGSSAFGSTGFKMGGADTNNTAMGSHAFGKTSFGSNPPSTETKTNASYTQGGFGKFSQSSASPFGGLTTNSNSSPFGGLASNSNNSPFGGSTSNSKESPFGAVATQNESKSIFGSAAQSTGLFGSKSQTGNSLAANKTESKSIFGNSNSTQPAKTVSLNTNSLKDVALENKTLATPLITEKTGLFGNSIQSALPESDPFQKFKEKSKSDQASTFSATPTQPKSQGGLVQNNVTPAPSKFGFSPSKNATANAKPKSANDSRIVELSDSEEESSDSFCEEDEVDEFNDFEDDSEKSEESEEEVQLPVKRDAFYPVKKSEPLTVLSPDQTSKESVFKNKMLSKDSEKAFENQKAYINTSTSEPKSVNMDVEKQLEEKIEDFSYDFEFNNRTKLNSDLKKLLDGKYLNFDNASHTKYQDFLKKQLDFYEANDPNIEKLNNDWISERSRKKIEEEAAKKENEIFALKQHLERLMKEKEDQEQLFIEADKQRRELLNVLRQENERKKDELNRLSELSKLEDEIHESIQKEYEQIEKANEAALDQIEELHALDQKQMELLAEDIRKENERIKEEEKRREAHLQEIQSEMALDQSLQEKRKQADEAAAKLIEEEEKEKSKQKENHKSHKKKRKGKKKSKNNVSEISHVEGSESSNETPSINPPSADTTSLKQIDSNENDELVSAALETNEIQEEGASEQDDDQSPEKIKPIYGEESGKDEGPGKGEESDKDGEHSKINDDIDELVIIETPTLESEASREVSPLPLEESTSDQEAAAENSESDIVVLSESNGCGTGSSDNIPSSGYPKPENTDSEKEDCENLEVPNEGTIHAKPNPELDCAKTSIKLSSDLDPAVTVAEDATKPEKLVSNFEDDEILISKNCVPISIPLLTARGNVEYPADFEKLSPMSKEMKKIIYDVFIDFDILQKNIKSMNEYFSDQLDDTTIFHTLKNSSEFANFWRFFEIETLLQGAERKSLVARDLLDHHLNLMDDTADMKKKLTLEIRELSRYKESLDKMTKADNQLKLQYLNSKRPLPFENVLVRRRLRQKIAKLQIEEKTLQSKVLILKSQIYPQEVVKDQRSIHMVLSTLQRDLYAHADEINALAETLKKSEEDSPQLLTYQLDGVESKSLDLSLSSVKKEPTTRISNIITRINAHKTLSSILHSNKPQTRYSSM